MAGRGRVFISHAREDTARAASLVKWLSAWGVDNWFEAQAQESGQLAQTAQMALTESAVFLRICTPAATRSYWMSLELGAFLSLQADEQRRGMANRRLLVSLILDPDYQRQPFDHSNPIIDATTKPQAEWLSELRAVLDLPPDPSLGQQAVTVAQVPVTRAGAVTMSRRRVLGTGIAGVAALAVAGSTGLLLLQRQRGPAHPPASATATSGKPPTVRDPNLAWWFKTGAEITAVPALVNGTLYFGSWDGTIYAVDAATGHSVWNISSNAQYKYSAAVGTQLLFFTADSPGGSNSVMIGVDLKGDLNGGQPPWEVDDELFGDPIAANGLVFSGHLAGVVARRQDPNTPYQQGVWFADTTGGKSDANAGVFAITRVDNVIYAGTNGGNLYAFDASNADVNLPAGAAEANAKMLWVYKTGGTIFRRAAVANGIVYAGSYDHFLHAIDAASGRRKWTFQTGDVVKTAPLAANGVVYVGSHDGTFYALDALSGKQIWAKKTGGAVGGGALSANTIYFSSNDKYLYAVDAASGSVQHQYQMANTPTNTPALANGLVYAADTDGYLYAFKAL
jgi:outer membrane protein assembly factor BamB